jgi:hypothetical protein
MTGPVFISYRHSDAAYARALHLELAARTSDVLIRDVDAIDGGDDLRSVIPALLQRAESVVAVVGPGWDVDGDDADLFERSGSWVRFELSLALAWRKHIVPVLMGGATMPRRDRVPRDLAGFSDLVAIPVRDADWDHDINRLSSLIGLSAPPDRTTSPVVIDAGPVAGGNITISGDVVAGRDLHLGPGES